MKGIVFILAGEEKHPYSLTCQEVSAIVRRDLNLSGLFRTVWENISMGLKPCICS